MSLLDTKEGREALCFAIHEAQCNIDREPNPDRWPIAAFEHAPVYEAITDPAKLAALIADEGRRLGFGDDSAHDIIGDEWRFTAKVTKLCNYDEIMLVLRRPMASFPEPTPSYTKLPQARTILAKLLQLPPGARDDADRILRGAL